MKIYTILFLVSILILPILGNAQDTSAHPAAAPSPRTHLSLLYDPGFSMISGAEDILTVNYALTRGEDALLGTRWFREDNLLGKSCGVIARFAKYALIDVPVDYFSVVAAHEYVGHGARYRELGFSNVDYGFDAPPPYGKGGGEASVLITGNVISNDELLGIWQGGMEVHQLINRQLAIRWMSSNEIQYRDAFLYFWSWQIRFAYIKGTEDYLPSVTSDNDPSAYIRILNKENGFADPAHPQLTVKELKSMVAFDLANPFVVFALYTGLKTYLWDGNTAFDLPTIRFGQIDYLPLIRTGLTPFGLEYHLENYLRFGDVTSLVDVRMGDQTFHKSWGGLGVAFQNIYAHDEFSANVNLDVWTQPALRFDNIPGTSKGGGVGGAFSIRGYYDLNGTNHPLAAVIELGYKSVGFLEGYQFDTSPLFRIGIGIRL